MWLGLLFATTLGAAEDWVRIKTPFFTVLSEASAANTREWTSHLEIFRNALAGVMPVNAALLDPVTVVLFRNDRRLRPFKPVENGQPARVAGFFVRLPTRNTIAVATEGARQDVRRVIFHEIVHWHLSAAARALPLWMEEGLAEVFSSFSISGDRFELGAPPGDYLRYLKVAPRMSVAELWAIDAVRFNGRHNELAQVFYYQSWALMHSLLFDSGEAGFTRVGVFLAEPATEAGTAHDLERYLEVTVPDLERRLAAYLQAKFLNLRRHPIDRAAVERSFVTGSPDPGEIDLALGNLLMGSGRSADAEHHFRRVMQELPKDARGFEGVAACQVATSRFDEAKVLLAAAVNLPNATFLGHFTLAQIQVREIASTQLATGKPDFSAPIAAVQRALQLNPRFRPAYELFATMATLQPAAHPVIGAWLAEGLRQFPESWEIRTGSTAHAIKAGDVTQAQAQLAAALRLLPPGNLQALRQIESLARDLGLEKDQPSAAVSP